jgi:hypothetical protein
MRKGEKDDQEKGAIITIEDVKRVVREIQEKFDRCRYRTNVLLEVFVNHPESLDDGPVDLTLFYISIMTVLRDIVEDGTEASEALSDLFHSKALEIAEVAS